MDSEIVLRAGNEKHEDIEVDIMEGEYYQQAVTLPDGNVVCTMCASGFHPHGDDLREENYEHDCKKLLAQTYTSPYDGTEYERQCNCHWKNTKHRYGKRYKSYLTANYEGLCNSGRDEEACRILKLLKNLPDSSERNGGCSDE
jgi:hypothetical protein